MSAWRNAWKTRYFWSKRCKNCNLRRTGENGKAIHEEEQEVSAAWELKWKTETATRLPKVKQLGMSGHLSRLGARALCRQTNVFAYLNSLPFPENGINSKLDKGDFLKYGSWDDLELVLDYLKCQLFSWEMNKLVFFTKNNDNPKSNFS